jgi:hypothetical protein
MFDDIALTRGISVTLPFNLGPDFRNTAFELKFEEPLTVEGDDNVRILRSDGAVAELIKRVDKGRNHSLGHFYMSFELTVTKIQ